MICCINCFKDPEVINIIRSQNKKGDCDFCGTADTYVSDTGLLTDDFDNLLNIYSPVESLGRRPEGIPNLLLRDALERDWNLFNIEGAKIQALIEAISSDRLTSNPELFESPVVIPERHDADYQDDHSLHSIFSWDEFVEEIKHENRFHLEKQLNLGVLERHLGYFQRNYSQDDQFFRARWCLCENLYQEQEMGSPPIEKNSVGRVNPRGISVLYLSSDIRTTIYELRAMLYDCLTICTFEPQQVLKIASFNNLDGLSPFILEDITEYAINKDHFKRISAEIAIPLRRQDSELDYLPTQYLSEFIKSRGYDGVEYLSTFNTSGFNLAVFDEKLLNCVETRLYEITSLDYEFSEVESK